MKQANLFAKLDRTLVALLFLGMGYLGLVLFLGTANPFLLVRGTSMQPTLHAGDLLISRAVHPTDIKVGDVIAFSASPEARQKLKMPPTIAHRVVGVEGAKGELAFVTKGDNSDMDLSKVPASAVRSVVVKNLGPVGRPIMLLTSRKFLLFLGLPVLAMVVIVFTSLWLMPGDKADKPAVGQVVQGAAQPVEMEQSLNRLALAVAEYGAHLQSHTAVVKHMAASSEGLEQAVCKQNDSADDFRQVMQQQTQVLADLATVVKGLKEEKAGAVSVGVAPRPTRSSRSSTRAPRGIQGAHQYVSD